MMDYSKSLENKLKEIRNKDARKVKILAIETSCDETAAAVVRGGRKVLSSIVNSQIAIHSKYGGVVPEVASRQHGLVLSKVVDAALCEAGEEFDSIDAVAVTCGPGLVGALLVGVSYAKGIALAKSLPLLGVNHIEGHICSNYITHPRLKPPFLCLIVSGGHSHIVLVEGYDELKVLGRTRDDAAGEAFDKIGRLLGVPYPGGPNLEKLASRGDPDAYPFPRGMKNEQGYDLTFSGLKTAVINMLHKAREKGQKVNAADVAASFQAAVVETLVEKTFLALCKSGMDKLAVCGGVSANGALRDAVRRRAAETGAKVYFPAPEYCGDNAAMIGCAGHLMLLRGAVSGLDLDANPSLGLN
ncbi:MAG: tRNA (adenosine(37)-N6)-threonylcarbamoyltransferase complex transferase subunit TsaD [Bacillota bacterium]|nr:tRNA (adenosine(37)-N6)-threonylcarbamoyltransferase complex transferase subunit TsaD [Bacillota bacterium]